jgi:hypothetical protein
LADFQTAILQVPKLKVGNGDIQATKKFIVNALPDRYPMSHGVEVMGLLEFLELLKNEV